MLVAEQNGCRIGGWSRTLTMGSIGSIDNSNNPETPSFELLIRGAHKFRKNESEYEISKMAPRKNYLGRLPRVGHYKACAWRQ
jgi:hypothetical protein